VVGEKMKWLRNFAANDKHNNSSYKFRAKRFELFNKLLIKSNFEKTDILDIGGTNYFWDQWKKFLNPNLSITIVNIAKTAIFGYKGILGDANNLSFLKNNTVDILLSNSLIEHLGEFQNQKIFAEEVQRISKYHFIQTPAFLFPLEPHFLFPFFHWLPKFVRIFIHQKLNLGWYNKEENYKTAKTNVEEIRILRKSDLKKMFPKSKIIVEKFIFMPKSYIVTNLLN
jgi:hypothetical protein